MNNSLNIKGISNNTIHFKSKEILNNILRDVLSNINKADANCYKVVAGVNSISDYMNDIGLFMSECKLYNGYELVPNDFPNPLPAEINKTQPTDIIRETQTLIGGAYPSSEMLAGLSESNKTTCSYLLKRFVSEYYDHGKKRKELPVFIVQGETSKVRQIFLQNYLSSVAIVIHFVPNMGLSVLKNECFASERNSILAINKDIDFVDGFTATAESYWIANPTSRAIHSYNNVMKLPNLSNKNLHIIGNISTSVKWDSLQEKKTKAVETVAASAMDDSVRIFQTNVTRDQGLRLQVYPLKTTFHEIGLLWEEPVAVRPGYKVTNTHLAIPVIFTEINGVDENYEYYKLVQKIKSTNSTKTFYINDVGTFKNVEVKLNKGVNWNITYERIEECISEKGINWNRLRSMNLYPYPLLSEEVQRQFEITTEILMKQEWAHIKMPQNALFKLIFNINDVYMRALHSYRVLSDVNPKVVVYINDERMLKQDDCAFLMFMHLMGCDVLAFAPTGYQLLGQNIKRDYYNSLDIGEYNFDLPKFFHELEKPKISFLKNLFK